jgi:HEAT repeat protein
MRVVISLSLLVIALGGCSRPRAPLTAGGKPVSHWVGLVKDPDARQRVRAVKELGRVGTADAAALPALTASLKDADARVRAEAVLALLNIGPEARSAAVALEEASQTDRDAKVRAYARKALERVRGG